MKKKLEKSKQKNHRKKWGKVTKGRKFKKIIIIKKINETEKNVAQQKPWKIHIDLSQFQNPLPDNNSSKLTVSRWP